MFFSGLLRYARNDGWSYWIGSEILRNIRRPLPKRATLAQNDIICVKVEMLRYRLSYLLFFSALR